MSLTRKSAERSKLLFLPAFGEYYKLLTLVVKERKLRWFVHVSRSSGLAKTSLQVTVKEEVDRRKDGKGMDFASTTMVQAKVPDA